MCNHPKQFLQNKNKVKQNGIAISKTALNTGSLFSIPSIEKEGQERNKTKKEIRQLDALQSSHKVPIKGSRFLLSI